MRRYVQGHRHLSGGNISQTKMHRPVLGGWPSRSNYGKVVPALLRSSRRRQRYAVQPVVHLRLARETPAKQLSLQLPQLDLLIRHRIIRRRTRPLNHNLSVLPADVAQRQSPRTGELLQRPVAAAFELGRTFAQVVSARNRGRLGEIDVSVIASVQVGIAEIADTSARLQG